MENNFIRSIRIDSVKITEPYLRALPAIGAIIRQGGLAFHRPVTFLVGENGSGKSTLLEAIAVAAGFNAEGGTRNFNFSTRATHSQLYEALSTVRGRYPKDGFFLRAESFYNVASNIDELDLRGSYGGLSLHEQSHGESFLALIRNRFSGSGLYLLDEPEAALSVSRLMTLLVEMQRLVNSASQLIVATHSPILLAYPQAEILELSSRGIHPVEYRQTEPYRLTHTFLENPERMLHYLLEEQEGVDDA